MFLLGSRSRPRRGRSAARDRSEGRAARQPARSGLRGSTIRVEAPRLSPPSDAGLRRARVSPGAGTNDQSSDAAGRSAATARAGLPGLQSLPAWRQIRTLWRKLRDVLTVPLLAPEDEPSSTHVATVVFTLGPVHPHHECQVERQNACDRKAHTTRYAGSPTSHETTMSAGRLSVNDVTFEDRRRDRVRPVRVLVDVQWCAGELEAYRGSFAQFRAFLREGWTRGGSPGIFG